MSNLRLQTSLCKSLLLLLLLLTACQDTPSSPPIATDSPALNDPEAANLPAFNQQDQSSLPMQYAANSSLKFEHISVNDGLSQNGAFSIIQDSQGFMWFGTQDGLDRYDGVSYTIYKHDPDDPTSISDNWIWTVFEDSLGTIWIGTLSGGLNSYDRALDQFSQFQHDPEDKNSLSDNEVLTI